MRGIFGALVPCLAGLILCSPEAARGQAVASEWRVGNGNWNVPTNWIPNDVPDNGLGLTYDVQIGSLPAAANAQVTFIPEDGTTDTINSLILSNGADIFTNGNQLLVQGQATVDGAGTTLRVDLHNTAGTFGFDADNLDVNNGGTVSINGGDLNVDVLMEINAGSFLNGRGRVNVGDADATAVQALENSGSIIVNGLLASVNVLRLETNGVDTIDLDGDSEAGLVDVSNESILGDALRLEFDAALADAFGGTLQVGRSDTVSFLRDFSFGGATVELNGGSGTATINGAGAITDIAGTSISVAGRVVIDNDMTFSETANTIALAASSTLTLNGDVTIPDASALSFALNANLVVAGATSITEPAGDFDWDGPSSAKTTVQGSGSLNLTVNHVDAGNDIYDGTLNLNDGGDLAVQVNGTEWVMSGTLVKNNAGTSTVSGDRVVVQNGAVTVNAGLLRFSAPSTWDAGASLTVAAGSEAELVGATTFSGSTSISGAGTVQLTNSSTTDQNTTISVATLDLDGNAAGQSHTINGGANLTITSAAIDTDGNINDAITLRGDGSTLTVSGPASWEMQGTLTANSLASGTATLAGTSRLVLTTATGLLNVNGNTTVSSPVTFDAGSITTVAAAAALTVVGNAIYNGGTITGAGNFVPASPAVNTVTADTTISTASFDFDSGGWTVQSEKKLTVDVGDYDNSAANMFDNSITILSGTADVRTADPAFVFNTGTLTLNNTTGTEAKWTGQPLQLGSDTGTLDADLNVTGTGLSTISTSVTFESDADVNISSNASLNITGAATFNSVNGLANAEFTGAGTLATSGAVTVNEATTINMVGGTVDLDGTDFVGNPININAALTINAETLSGFGKSSNIIGTNTMIIDGNLGSGRLTVNLDDPAKEWTLNSSGVLSLIHGAAPVAMISGSPVNLNGTVDVGGAVEIAARVDIGGTATVNVQAAGLPLVLSGGSLAAPNTIAGGTINGPGLLQLPSGKALTGFGMINSNVACIDSSDLLANDGILTVNGSILDARNVGTADSDGTLNVPAAWNSSVVTTVLMKGGTFQGGTLTLENSGGIVGFGTVTCQVINNTILHANVSQETLLFTNTASDWDGDDTPEDGILRASNGGTLQISDSGTFAFNGTVDSSNGGTVFANGFTLDFEPDSNPDPIVNTGGKLILAGGKFKSSGSIPIGGTVTVAAGADSTLQSVSGSLDFESGSATTMTGSLQLITTNGRIFSGATFSGAGSLKINAGSVVGVAANAVIDVLVDNSGILAVSNAGTAGRVDVKDFQQRASGEVQLDLNGTSLANHDRLLVSGTAQIAGNVKLTLGGGYVPVAGDTFNVVSAIGGVIGIFNDIVQPAGMPAGLAFKLFYQPTIVQLQVVAASPFDQWINNQPGLTEPEQKARTANPDGDELNNFGEFALGGGNPASGANEGKIVGKVGTVAGSKVLTLTIPVRAGAVADAGDPPGGPLALKQVADGVNYFIQAGNSLGTWLLDVSEVVGADATAIQSGLPALNSNWTYRTFRAPGVVGSGPVQFLRVKVTDQ